MYFAKLLSIAGLVGFVVALPSVTSAAQPFELTQLSGCGSSGPLGTGHFEWYIIASCSPGSSHTCQVTDASGCEPGVVKKIGSVEVDDPNDTVQYEKKSGTNSVGFTCPSGGQIRCQANLNDRDDGPSYSLRVN